MTVMQNRKCTNTWKSSENDILHKLIKKVGTSGKYVAWSDSLYFIKEIFNSLSEPVSAILPEIFYKLKESCLHVINHSVVLTNSFEQKISPTIQQSIFFSSRG